MIPLLSVQSAILFTVRNSTSGTPRPVCSSTTVMLKQSFATGYATCVRADRTSVTAKNGR